MTTYRTGNNWGVTIVLTPEQFEEVRAGFLQALREDAPSAPRIRPESALDRPVVPDDTPDAHSGAETVPADSCTCVYRPNGQADPNCPVHQGRRARGPKPPPVGPGCICDGSGRPCPRHGVVI